MNTRIAELVAAEMSEYYDGAYHDSACARDQLARFAELIMKECVEIAEPKPQDVGEWSAGMRLVQKRINEHFGLIEQDTPYNRCLL